MGDAYGRPDAVRDRGVHPLLVRRVLRWTAMRLKAPGRSQPLTFVANPLGNGNEMGLGWIIKS
jgi:hypothetical protein